jgi:hypothetical protein
MKHLDIISPQENNYTYTATLSIEECHKVAEWIIEENKINGKHMLEKSAEELFVQAKEY